MPLRGEAVVIPAGQLVTYDVFSDVEIGRVTIQGTLAFARDRNTRLDVGNVMVDQGGYLDMGTATDPIPATVAAEIRFAISPTAQCVGGPNFVDGDIGLWVFSGGRWDAHGAPLRTTWTKLVQTAAVGTSVVRVADDVTDWLPGAWVVVTPTDLGKRGAGLVAAYPQFEEFQIVRVTRFTGYSEIQLSGVLRYTHDGTIDAAGEVALLSRNVVVTSKYPNDEMNGHTMFMGGATGGISYTEFRELGNLGCLGRYPVHFHVMGDSSRGMRVRGASIWRSDNNFLNVHGSSGVTVEDTVGYHAPGLGYYIGEPAAGVPSNDTLFVGNLAARVVWRQGALQAQQRASGFWISTLNNTQMVGNVSSGSWGTSSNDSGFHVAEDSTHTPGFTPLFLVRNEAHSNNGAGLFTWRNHFPVLTVVDFRGWRNGNAGINWGAYNLQMRVHRSKLFENGAHNFRTTSVNAYMVDSELYGSTAYPVFTGAMIAGYFLANDPTKPAVFARNTFSGHSLHFSQDHAPCQHGSSEELNPLSEDCSATYLLSWENQFIGGGKAFDFGWHRNANSFFRIRNWNGVANPVILATNFRLTRKDRPRPNLAAYYYAPFDSWLDPQDVPTSTNIPPQATLTGLIDGATLGTTVAMQVSITSGSAASVKYYVDEKLLATQTSGPFTFTWTSTGWARRFAHVYAAVTDSTGNTGYTQVIRLQRFALGGPAPTPVPTPGVTPTPGPTPAPTPQPRPTVKPSPRGPAPAPPRPTARLAP
ncbi:MAG: G8 domain-containing protein, partial [Armatimonadota bacterium]